LTTSGEYVGVSHDGGYSPYARVKGDWLTKVPQGLSLWEAMAYGTAGYTAGIAVVRMEDRDIVRHPLVQSILHRHDVKPCATSTPTASRLRTSEACGLPHTGRRARRKTIVGFVPRRFTRGTRPSTRAASSVPSKAAR